MPNPSSTGHCLYCADTSPDLRSYFLVHFWITYLLGFGGGTLSAILTMRPDKAPISILSDPRLGLMWTLCWWSLNYCPGQLPRKLHSWWPVKTVTKACVSLCKSQLMVARVCLACDLYPGSIAAPIILATIAGSGGTLIGDTIRFMQGVPKKTHEFNVPTYSFWSSFLPSLFAYVACRAPRTAFLSPEEALACITTLLVLHSLLSDLTGLPLDWTRPVWSTVLTLANIPLPAAPAVAPKAASTLVSHARAVKEAPAAAPGADASRNGKQQQPASEPRISAPEAQHRATIAKAGSFEAQTESSWDGEPAAPKGANGERDGARARVLAVAAQSKAKVKAANHGWTEVVGKGKRGEEAKKAK